MKVLWFTNNPCSSTERQDRSGVAHSGSRTVTGGWHGALEKAVRSEVELEIAYLSPERKQEEFVFKGVRYYSINPFKSQFYITFRLKRLLMSYRCQDEKILSRMHDIIEESSPDIIHIHGTEKCFGLICSRDPRHDSHRMSSSPSAEDGYYITDDGRKIPVVISIQGLMGAIAEKFFCGISRDDIRRHESIRSNVKKQSALRLYNEFVYRAKTEREILESARFIFGRTRWDKEMTSAANPSSRYFTVGEIMREPFFRMKWNPGKGRCKSNDNNNCKSKYNDNCRDKENGEDAIRLVSTLSTGPYKGYENLLRTADVLKRDSAIRFEWTVIGYGADDEYVAISQKVTSLSSEECGIRFAGRRSAAEVAEILCASDIYCQVSHIENSPNSLCEAMLIGMPCIATDVGGTSSMLSDGEEGILVPDCNPKAYARAIERMATDSELRTKLGAAARTAALKKHSPEIVARQLIDAYSAVLQI